jgi:7-keto-8-aminopelargonate synthetase-like enzyme
VIVNKFGNIRKRIELSEPSYASGKETGLFDIAVRYVEPPRLSAGGREFINMCSCSYLGLDSHPRILEGAIEGIRTAGSLHLTTSRIRIIIDLLRETEEALSAHFACQAMVFNSCGTVTSSFLPVLASGFLTGDVKPVMIFDKFAHVSMHHIRPICGDETEVHTCNNNDLDFIEDMCRKHPCVAYVSDGTYSIEGQAPVRELRQLQDKYGLFLYFDDSHGLSITGSRGEGYVRENMPELSDRTVVAASLAKAFGAAGGVLMSGPSRHDVMTRYGNSWSQYLNSAGLGGINASLEIHRSPELGERQRRWRENLDYLDQQLESQNRGTRSPIRLIYLKSPARAIEVAKETFERGFYTSAIFFPAVPKDKSGLRVMPRADIPLDDMKEFVRVLQEVAGDDLRPLS